MEIRVSDQDEEIAAAKALRAAFEPLDLDTRARLLKWAEDRFVRSEKNAITEAAETAIMGQMKALDAEARMRGLSFTQLVHTMSAIRERFGLAPIDHNTEPAAREIAAVGR